jgi:hypothetical protein
MAEYDIKKVKYFKKLLKNRVDYWESGLPVDFCIARRTRDILVSRSIVDNFQKSKTSGNLTGHLVFALSTVWQEYFQTYVQNVATIGEFLAIFIKPSKSFIENFKTFDKAWYPKINEAKKTELDPQDDKKIRSELVELLRNHRESNYWESETDWEYFLNEYLKFLLNNKSEDECIKGMLYFIEVVAKMHSIVEDSGWVIDYQLYNDPMKIWGGVNLASKIRFGIQARSFSKRARSKLYFWK